LPRVDEVIDVLTALALEAAFDGGRLVSDGGLDLASESRYREGPRFALATLLSERRTAKRRAPR
jgi:hypothetical protein